MQKLSQTFQHIKVNIANNLFMFKLAWSIHPQRVVAEFAVQAGRQLANVFFTVYFMKYIIESISIGRDFQQIVYFIILTLVLLFALVLLDNWYDYRFRPLSDLKLYEKLYLILFRKAATVELKCFEDHEFYNKYTKAIQEADIRVSAVLANLSRIIFVTLATISIFAVMYAIDPWVVWFALLPIIGNFYFGKKLNRIQFQQNDERVPYQRKMDYVNRVIYLSHFAKEIRLSRIFSVLRNTYIEGYDGVISVVHKYRVKAGVISFFKIFTTFTLIFQGVLLYGAYLAIVKQSISISSFIVLGSAMVGGAWSLIRLSDSFVEINKNGIYIENLKTFLSYVSEIQEHADPDKPIAPPIQQLAFRKLQFTYDGAERPSIRHITMEVNKNEKIALVGHNGAGKSTLIKLMMRLYDPTEGEILLNGRNIKEFDLMSYRSLYGTVFQDFKIFSMTIAENVLMRDVDTEEDRQLVINALKKSRVYDKVATLPEGIDTMLTKEFDEQGVVLSGGEFQKIAIARIFAQQAELLILDEPTSALDPIAEFEIFESMMEACKDKAVVIISHRMSSAMLADRIYYMENGEIQESGSHMELMQLQGKYAELFLKQAEKYMDQEELAEVVNLHEA
ncbi:MAG: ABC transporter ATP-binding protein/permease [Candidatus Pristimantibacillus lignocellulolyticus]|uniref:ABC transporter ATP-binding protein/permease n=1 Tax=Candidatus Pristimantibacillus lignocellulolyticus TaxID=2994561 RepID=A0A9J6ZDF9_9BACL|nr:MAG: ABC transporter ATP-binding protein/permease [Candidatus Pristimantibacillus lignocellulolyticus]